ncbi:Dihydrofolate reductase [Geodia barretti]|uniref:dihydrofolate reductase n=1 Tax=Geodia barretti TaxID=519541 RepID=A0AA35T0A7_GEOBA|nr:Dihydrofolate reductase [Geodia barretti]
MTEDGVIGLGGTLPWHYSADLKRFKRVTLNSTIIMGRKTWDSLPIQPLPERQNIVITRNKSLEVEHYSSLAQAIQVARYERIWFIGGGFNL